MRRCQGTLYVAATRSMQHQSLRPDEAVGKRREAREPRREAIDPLTVIEVEHRPVFQYLLGDLGVVLQALGRIGDLARGIDLAIRRRIAIMAIVERALAGEEIIEIGIGIDAAAPTEEIGAELALLGEIERGGEFRRVDIER